MKWLGERGRDGGIDTVPMHHQVGGMSLCGKHAVAPDPEAAMQRCSATTIVCLVEDHELAERWPEYVDWLNERLGDSAVWFPIHDLHAPPLDGVRPLLDDLVSRLDRGEHLLIHCAAGIGRAGTIGTCLLIRRGMAPDAALAHIAACRPMAGPEVGTQLDLVNALAAEHGHRA